MWNLVQRLNLNKSSRDVIPFKTNGSFVNLSSYLGRLRLRGSDALDLLDRLSTNRLTDLVAPGMGMGSVLTTNKGRIIDFLGVHLEDDGLLVVTSGEATEKIEEWIDFYTIMEDVETVDISSETFQFRILGSTTQSLSNDVAQLAKFHALKKEICGIECIVIRSQMLDEPCLDVIGPSVAAKTVSQELEVSGIHVELSLDEYERIRVESGYPAFGSELTEDFNPLEAGLIEHISFNKGCYIGQEVVARLNTYEKVQKKLVKLVWNGAIKGKDLSMEGHTAGVITSALDGVGLGFVRNAYAKFGTILNCGAISVTVTEILAE
tara:strand:- start:656 stop:1618 length:963 start_codon:yes stop_codon:yes gene_type:complete